MQKALVDSINEMIEDICCQSGVSREWIYEIAVGANCTMMHMLLGITATSLGKSPYAPVFVRGKDIRAKEIGLCAAEETRLYCLPSVSAFILEPTLWQELMYVNFKKNPEMCYL